MQIVAREASVMHVAINFVPVDKKLAESSMHQLGPSFVRHIEMSIEQGGRIKGEILSQLSATQSIQEDVRSYLRTKTYNLQEGWTNYHAFSEEQKVVYLKKMLESSMHIARKVLCFHDVLEDDSKKSVTKTYLKFAPDDMQDLFLQLQSLDTWYTNRLEKNLNKFTEATYKNVLWHLYQEIDISVEFARRNALLLGGPP